MYRIKITEKLNGTTGGFRCDYAGTSWKILLQRQASPQNVEAHKVRLALDLVTHGINNVTGRCTKVCIYSKYSSFVTFLCPEKASSTAAVLEPGNVRVAPKAEHVLEESSRG